MRVAHADLPGELPAAFGVARSFAGRKWILRDAGDERAGALVRAAGVSPVLARLLAARGIDLQTVEDVLHPTLKRLLPEPNSLLNMERAVDRAADALERGERIAVFGDYDVDGACSSALLHDLFSGFGAPPRLYIPDRMTEGYGPTAGALLRLKDEGADLVITVDCGATAVEALSAARNAGLDVIVLDHHAVEHPPPAFAQVNPNQRGDTSALTYLCAAGVTFLFAVALNRALRDRGWHQARGSAEPDLRRLLDLVGLATVCDVVPLVGVNRAFVRSGLAQFDPPQRTGLAALAAAANASGPYSPYHLGFVFGPRINAGGRVGRCSLGAELLIARNTAQAGEIAQALDSHNRERQAIEKLMLDEAIAMAALQGNASFLFAAREGWHSGVVGIVAGRLKDRFGKPAFVAGFEGGMARGSARSVNGVDIGAIVRAAKDAGHLSTGGGHAMAAGFSLTADQAEGFQRFLAERFGEIGLAHAGVPELEIDAVISPSGATPELAGEIALAGPYGAGNPEPLVAACDVRVVFADVVGREHVRMRVSGGDGSRLDAIAFRSAGSDLGRALLASRGKTVHLAGRLRADLWNGKTRVQLQVEDAAPASA
ncbi:MAG TPA: single-stranded-DNA-specific exonuclease RecJ [Rhizomicrobium sp.]|nr:single-stranded-DNA-specific exonuclease RecJ [Rhizomicrobium sp.]